ncbi:hypothetical protein L6164_034800 [Bauhinia variegata]|uniref:Uncharacterized protein n=1 Tax=Bauhinia variegata TaxID=167791 RepID=A0ACB9KWJ6_BAUVA|nr:hypothetical protein L6164_034800 [Bauhinia variegata]
MNGDSNNSFVNGGHHFTNGDSGYGPNHSMAHTGRKRGWHHNSSHGTSPDQLDGGYHWKLYVSPVPRTSTEAEIRSVFGGHGTIVEVVLLRDKRTGFRQGSCFVKFATLEAAESAIRALSNQYTFPGESFPVVVKYAERDLGRRDVLDKVFVGHLSKDASKNEIEDIFSPYGHVEDIFIAYDEQRQSRGYGFVKFSNREMAWAAIKGLNGTFTMRGSNCPLIVRFADPKKPKSGEPRGNSLQGNTNLGPYAQEPTVRPLPNFGNCIGGSVPPMAPHYYTIPHPQVASYVQNWEPPAPVMQQPFPPQPAHPQLASMSLQPIPAPNLSSQPVVAEMQRQSHPTDSSTQHIEQQLNSQVGHQTRSDPTFSSSTSPDMPVSPQEEDPPDCDWSEHTCPDGYKYYYNCVTCDSRWDKPEEYALYEQELQKQQEQEDLR